MQAHRTRARVTEDHEVKVTLPSPRKPLRGRLIVLFLDTSILLRLFDAAAPASSRGRSSAIALCLDLET